MGNGADEPQGQEGVPFPGRVAQPDYDNTGSDEPSASLVANRLAVALAWISLTEVRTDAVGQNLSTDAVWNILLDLFVQRCRKRRVSVGDLCIASGVPESTALRWIKLLQERGLIQRTPDTDDARRAYLSLTRTGLTKMEDALDAGADSFRRAGIVAARST